MSKHYALLVYPEFPPSYWGYKYVLDFVGKKASMPPLGLLTLAAMFPEEKYSVRLVDMNVEPLTDEHLDWADGVFTSTMVVQQRSLNDVIARCHAMRKPVIAGGPHPTVFHDEISGVSHFVLGEVESFFHEFLTDFEQNRAKPIYRPGLNDRNKVIRPDLANIPLPRYDLIDLQVYGSVCLQYSRGCPWDCDFCDITKLYGRVPRTKSNEQVMAELDLLYDLGWRGSIFFVDDNLIGNKKRVRQLMPAITEWQRQRNYPFSFNTEASVNLVDIDGLTEAMVAAGFDSVFVGLETPNPVALLKTNKIQNVKDKDPDYLLHAVQTIHQAGMEVTAGFILGLDGDGDAGAFDRQIEFIQQAGIPIAMVGLLTAIKGTNLYERYEQEGRLLTASTGNNVSLALNFVPEMDRDVLIEGYKRVLSTLYGRGLKHYFERCYTLLEKLQPRSYHRQRIGKTECLALLKSLKRQLFSWQGPAYLRFVIKVGLNRPRLLPVAIKLAVKGYHFQKITSEIIRVDDFATYLESELYKLKELVADFALSQHRQVRTHLQNLFADIKKRHEEIHESFQPQIKERLIIFQEYLNTELANIAQVVSVPIPQFIE
jgi:radical SAM superfamily enzyme YgiQ (UPF0313 family)